MRLFKAPSPPRCWSVPPPPFPPRRALPDADPAMWVVSDADTTIYLFGTFHALDGKRDWFNDEVQDRRSTRRRMWCWRSSRPRSGRVARDDHAARDRHAGHDADVEAVARRAHAARRPLLKTHGMPPTALDRFKPFFASLTRGDAAVRQWAWAPSMAPRRCSSQAVTGTPKKLGEVETVDAQFAHVRRHARGRAAASCSKRRSSTKGRWRSEIQPMLDAWNNGDAVDRREDDPAERRREPGASTS